MKALLLGIFLILAPNLYADNPVEVTAWTQKTLLKTLTIDYNYKNEDNSQLKKAFTANAWNALRGFLGGYLQDIVEQQLSVHPVFLIEPQIVDSGIASGIKFSRINTEVALPELRIKVAFSIIVIQTTPSSVDPYIIQSLSMVKEENNE